MDAYASTIRIGLQLRLRAKLGFLKSAVVLRVRGSQALR